MKTDHTNCVAIRGKYAWLHPTKGWRKGPITPVHSTRRLDRIKSKKYHLENAKSKLHLEINKLTNWQRTQWAKAKFPKSIKRIKVFQKMRKNDEKKQA